jgi:hypothetical protein
MAAYVGFAVEKAKAWVASRVARAVKGMVNRPGYDDGSPGHEI